MINKKAQFLQELEHRLEENRRIADRSYIPPILRPLASYLGFHTFRILFFLSFLLVIFMFWFSFDATILLGKKIFFYK